MTSSNDPYSTVRPRPRGQGHRRRIEMARMSRTSVYETIEEEASSPAKQLSPIASPTADTKIHSVVHAADSDAESMRGSGDWSHLNGASLREYYALKNEAQDMLEESKRVWTDTAFSLFALQGRFRCADIKDTFSYVDFTYSLRTSTSPRWYDGHTRTLATQLP
jgi:serine/arginine repetitive matrix protein 2